MSYENLFQSDKEFKNYLESSAKTWNLNIEKAYEIYDFIIKALMIPNLQFGKMAILVDKTFKKKKENKFALFELGKTIGTLYAIEKHAIEKQLEEDSIHQFNFTNFSEKKSIQ